ncbi:class I SAM-dependent methyltransferase [Paenibacillus yanchengensis]|uniref:Class I SAM-dependent methyltransferase n=1 Tax=Paenibacillus yanchengensis TaxID=2035833 RepID=A0ABW4YFT1_9BACL
MGFLSVLSTAHLWIKQRVQVGEPVIDATCGTGVDTLALAELTGKHGFVYAFDIQQTAILQSEKRLAATPNYESLASVQFIKGSHSNMNDYIKTEHQQNIAAIMFNLGYLPGGDEQIITEPSSTIAALELAISLLRKGGIITCVLYPGHAGGAEEAQLVESWTRQLPVHLVQVVKYQQMQRERSPYLIAIERK